LSREREGFCVGSANLSPGDALVSILIAFSNVVFGKMVHQLPLLCFFRMKEVQELIESEFAIAVSV
jgi:hypothetical protein